MRTELCITTFIIVGLFIGWQWGFVAAAAVFVAVPARASRTED